MALRVPDAARVGEQPLRAAAMQSPGVVPFQDARPGQMQQLGGALERFGAVAANSEMKWQARVDDARSDREKARYAMLQHEAISGPKGYRSLVGEAATGEARQKAIDDLRKAREDIAAGLDNDEQRQRFQDAADVFDLRARSAIDSHYGEQVQNHAIGSKAAYVESIIQQHVGTSQDPQASQVNRGVLAAESAALSQLHGDSPEQAKLRLLGYTTKMHELVVDDHLANGRLGEADAYLKAHQGEIEAGRRAGLVQTVREGQQRAAAAAARSAIADQSTRLAMQIPGEMVKEARALRGTLNQGPMSEAERQRTLAQIPGAGALPPVEPEIEQDPRKSPTYEDDARAKVDEMFAAGSISAEVRDATLDRLKADAADYRQQDARETEAVMRSAEKWLVDNPNEPVTAMPPNLYVEIQARGQLATIRGFAQNRRYVTDPKALASFDSLADVELQKVSRGELRLQLRGLLGDTDLNYALARHAKATGTAGDTERRILSVDDRLNEFMRKAGVLPRTGTGADQMKSEATYNLKRNVVERLRAFEDVHLQGKRPATDDELQQMFDSALMDKVIVAGSFYDSDPVPLVTLTDKQQEKAYVDVGGQKVLVSRVPDAVRKEIQRRVQARGRPAMMEADVVRTWMELGQPSSAEGMK